MEIFNPKGQKTGDLVDGVYNPFLHTIFHFMRNHNGFGMSLKVTMETLAANNCKTVLINFKVPSLSHPNSRFLPEFLRNRPGVIVDLKTPFSTWTDCKLIKTYEKDDPQCFVDVTLMEEIL